MDQTQAAGPALRISKTRSYFRAARTAFVDMRNLEHGRMCTLNLLPEFAIRSGAQIWAEDCSNCQVRILSIASAIVQLSSKPPTISLESAVNYPRLKPLDCGMVTVHVLHGLLSLQPRLARMSHYYLTCSLLCGLDWGYHQSNRHH